MVTRSAIVATPFGCFERRSGIKNTAGPERLDERQEREPEDRKIVRIDRCKKLRTQSFKAVSPDRSEDLVTGTIQIAIKKGLAEGSYDQPRDFGIFPRYGLVDRQDDGADQAVFDSTERQQCCSSGILRRRFLEPGSVVVKNLVGARLAGEVVELLEILVGVPPR